MAKTDYALLIMLLVIFSLCVLGFSSLDNMPPGIDGYFEFNNNANIQTMTFIESVHYTDGSSYIFPSVNFPYHWISRESVEADMNIDCFEMSFTETYHTNPPNHYAQNVRLW